MARGPSGRIVLEVPPELKRQLHSHLAAEAKSLKDWFLEQANLYLARQQPVQLSFPTPPERPPRKGQAKRRPRK